MESAEEISADAHQRPQTPVGEAMSDDFGEAAALILARVVTPLLCLVTFAFHSLLILVGARVKLLALIDVEEKRRRLGLSEFLVTPGRCVEEVGKLGIPVAFEQQFHPVIALPNPNRIAGVELPGFEEGVDQRPDRLCARPHGDKAPLPAVRERLRPRAAHITGRLRPALAAQ